MHPDVADTLIGAFYVNVCILTTSALLMGLTFARRERWTVPLRAALYALTSVALLLFTFPAGPELFIDLRLVPLALAAYRLGPGWALLAALPVTAYRVWVGGPALGGTLLHLTLVLLLASRLRHRGAAPHLPLRENARRSLLIFGPAALTVFPTFLLLGRPVTDAALPYLMVVTFSVLGFSLWTTVVATVARAAERAAPDAPTTDLLTGLPDRRAFELAAAPAGADTYLLLLDLDHFRALNEQHGHEVGDQVLQAAAQVLERQLGRAGPVYRLGGEEFAALLRAESVQDARQLADRARRTLPAQVTARLGRPDLRVTLSGGLVTAGPDALPRAERLLYAAKQAGRHRILDSWQRAPEGAANTPLNRTSPAVSTLRTLLQFIAGNGDPGEEPDLQALLNAAIACVPGAEAGSISVRGGEWSVVRVQSGYGDDLLGTRHTSEQMLHWHGDPAAWQAGQPRVLAGEELRRRSRDAHAPDSPEQRTLEGAGRQNELQANLLIPVRVQGNVYAELNLDSLSAEDAFDAESLQVAEEFGLWAAAILSASIRVRQALSSQDAALLTLGVALEARDMETQGHTRRVVDLATDLGRALNLGAGDLHMLRQGAALHDLGKLLIPDRILLKAGPLTPDEWATMQTHAALGADLAAQLTDLMPAVLDVIRSHHERWDGRGYPQGLRGDAIPLLARIFSVCDVFDALTSARPYKDAWSSEVALAEVAAQAGRQFDPQVVRAFLTLHASELGRPA